MPVVQLPGFPGGISISDAQYADYVARGILPMPMSSTTPFASTPNSLITSSNVTTGRTPCQIYEDAKRMGQSAAILAVLKAKCDAYQQAQAFAASPAAPVAMPSPATAAPMMMQSETAATPDEKKKWLLIGGGVLLVGLAGYLATRK